MINRRVALFVIRLNSFQATVRVHTSSYKVQLHSELRHRQCACAHTEAYTLRSEVSAVAASAVNFTVWSIIQVGGIL